MGYPYIKTSWQDHIVDPVSGAVIQQGTRFTGSRINNIEDAVDYLCNVHIPGADAEFLRIQLELEMLGRSPVNNGTFFDALDGDTPKAMVRDIDKAVLQNGANIGATKMVLDRMPFVVGEVVTIIDEEQVENVTITSITGNEITFKATTKAFKKGAFVTRSNSRLNIPARSLQFGNWSTYKVEVVK